MGEMIACAACGGAGGGPFGDAPTGWDVESYECERCRGSGVLDLDAIPKSLPKPGIAKARSASARPERTSRKTSG